MKTKYCPKCNQTKSIECFRINSAKLNKGNVDFDDLPRRYNCRDCEKIYNKNLKELHKSSPKKPKKCDCCGKKTNSFVLDHCHISNTFRGWLCKSCNKGIGILGDTFEAIELAYLYLKNNINKDRHVT